MLHSKAEILRGSREREKKIKNTRRVLGFLLVLVIVGAFIFLLNLNFLRLTSFNLVGQTSQDVAMIKQTIGQELAGHYFGLIPNNSVFFFSRTRLSDLLKKKFPSLQSVEIDSPDLNTLVIRVSDLESKTLWCSNSSLGRLCFYLNDAGEVYQTAPNFSESIILEFDSEALIKKIPVQVIDPRDLGSARDFLNFLKVEIVDWPKQNSGFRLARVNVLPLKDFEAIIVSSIDPGLSWKVLFNTRTGGDQLITNFHSLLKDPTLAKNWPDGKYLDYLDLRFDNKVFYRFK